MKKSITAVLMGLCLLGGVAAYGHGGGGGVPSPFVEASDRRVELADSEMYTLNGKVVFDNNDEAWFWVDLAKHPWLANQKRQQNPYYRLLGTKDQWRDSSDKPIQLTCIAHESVVNGAVEISLSPVSEAGAKSIVERHHHTEF